MPSSLSLAVTKWEVAPSKQTYFGSEQRLRNLHSLCQLLWGLGAREPSARRRGVGEEGLGLGSRFLPQARRRRQASARGWRQGSRLSRPRPCSRQAQAAGGPRGGPRSQAPRQSLHSSVLPAGRQRGYFFLGKKLNLFSLSFLARLASGPVMEGRGKLWALTRMLWDSLIAVLTPCSQDSISSCGVEGSWATARGAPAMSQGAACCFARRGRAGPLCTYLILAMEEPLAAIAEPRTEKGVLPWGHFCLDRGLAHPTDP